MKTIDGVPGFSIGGVHSSEFGIYLVSKSIGLLPKTRDYELTIFGKDGVKDFGTQLDQRPIDLVLKIQGEDRADLIKSMSDFAALIDPRKGYQQLIFDDDPSRYFLAKYTSANASPTVNYVINQAQLALGFKATDPFVYSAEEKSPSFSTVSGQTFTLFNEGTEEIPPFITIKAPVTLPQGATITINGVSVMYKGEITANDVIEIDTKNITVKKNGISSMRYWDGAFPTLQPGVNTIVETDSGGLGANVTFTYQERWLI
jgi:predicted phage tail component-like protein